MSNFWGAVHHDGFFYFSYKEIFSFQILYTKIIIIFHLVFLSSYIEQQKLLTLIKLKL